MKRFEVGKKYRCVLKSRKDLKDIVFKCVEYSGGIATLRSDVEDARVNKDNIGFRGCWQPEDFEEVKEVKTRTDFRVGDRVFDVRYGWGAIVDISDDKVHPIKVLFEIGFSDRYTLEGGFHLHAGRSLFFAEPIITTECLEKEEDCHIITIDGKEVKLSEESFQALKEQFK